MKITKFIIAFQFIISSSALSMKPDWELRSKMAREEYHLLIDAVMNQDYDKTMDLLFNLKIDPNPSHNGMANALFHAKSKRLAQLLIANGAQIPNNILQDEHCQRDDYPTDLLAFYLEKGYKISATRLGNNIRLNHAMEVVLHELPKFPLGLGNRAQEFKPEPFSCLKNRLEKAQLLLKFGANPYLMMTLLFHERSAFHEAAFKGDVYMCQLLIEHESIRKPSFITFLASCKQQFPRFYAQKDILRLLWNNLAPSRILALKDGKGKPMCELGGTEFKSVLEYSIKAPFNLESALAVLEELEQATRESHE